MSQQETTTLFRSEEMSLIQLFIPAEVAHTCVAELGELGQVQFRDVSFKKNENLDAFVGPVFSNSHTYR
jgi:V-type H+-transporting ATPase subunit a